MWGNRERQKKTKTGENDIWGRDETYMRLFFKKIFEEVLVHIEVYTNNQRFARGGHGGFDFRGPERVDFFLTNNFLWSDLNLKVRDVSLFSSFLRQKFYFSWFLPSFGNQSSLLGIFGFMVLI